MRITIEVDEKSGAVASSSSAAPPEGTVSAAAAAAPPASQAPPPEVAALAATTGAINGGPAPTLSASDVGPHPFVSVGAGMSEAQRAGAISAGSAAQGKPC